MKKATKIDIQFGDISASYEYRFALPCQDIDTAPTIQCKNLFELLNCLIEDAPISNRAKFETLILLAQKYSTKRIICKNGLYSE